MPTPPDPRPAAAPPLPRYPTLTIALHWASALAVFGAFALAWVREAADDKPLRAALLFTHSQLGLLVLVLLVMRLAARLLAPSTVVAPPGPAWQRWASTGGHLAIYALLMAQPLLGWAVMNAHGHDALLFGAWALPGLAAPDPDLADTLAEAHETAAWALLALISLHASAALWHHYFRRDTVLASMLPLAAPRIAPAHHTPLSSE